MNQLLVLKERQKQKWAFKRELKAKEPAPARKEALPTVSKTFVVVLDHEDDGSSSGHAVVGRRLLIAIADLEQV